MISPPKMFRLKTSNFYVLVLAPLLLISLLWLLFIGLTHMGLPSPKFNIEKFLDLGFFALSVFGVVVFLTMAPFQTIEGNLSPIFYAKMFNTPSAHFGVYVLLWSFLICFGVMTFQQELDGGKYLNSLYISLILAIIFAILFHRSWVLRSLYQPYLVNKYIQALKLDTSNEEIWLELFECAFKMIKQSRVSASKSFVGLMVPIYDKCSNEQQEMILKEDLVSLYKVAQELRPVARFMEEKWPSIFKKNQETKAPSKSILVKLRK